MRRIRRNKKINWFLIGILGLPLLAVGAYFWVTGMLSALETYRSPLQNSAPAPGAALGEPLTRQVVIVLMDALRDDTSNDATVMPVLNELRQVGAYARMNSRPPSFSAPGWTTLLTGAWPDINDSQVFNPPDENTVRAFTQDDLFASAQRANLRTAVFGYSWFEGMLVNSGVDDAFYTTGEDNVADEQVVAEALSRLGGDFQLVLIHIDQIDYAGHHEGGPRDPNWNAAAARADALLGKIVEKMDLAQDTLIVLADHGQIDEGGHGGNEPVTLVEPFVGVGVGILPGEYHEIEMVDVAPSLAVLLGTNIPASSQGRPLLEMLDISPEAAGMILDSVRLQQESLLAAYAQAIGQPVGAVASEAAVAGTQLALEQARMTRLAQERVVRNVIALFFALIPGYMLILRKERKAFWMLGGALAYLAIFNLRYAILDQHRYGLSWIPGMGEFITYMAVTSGVAVVLGWLLSMFGLRAFHKGMRTAAGLALGSIWFIIYLLAIPALLNFAVNGVLPSWTLPEFSVQYLGFFALAQVLFVAVIGLLLVGLSVLAARWLEARKN